MSRLSWPSSAERPGWNIWWLDDAGELIDFSSGYTFSLKIGPRNGTALLTKTTGITGAAGSGVEPTGTPNVVVTWSTGELAIAQGVYRLELTATTSSTDRVLACDVAITGVVS